MRSPEAAAGAAIDAFGSEIGSMANRLEDCTRVARLASLAGLSAELLTSSLIARQKPDGGWIEPEETLWCCTLLCGDVRATREVDLALGWMGSQRLASGGWGRSDRDIPRIPTTALILRLLGARIGIRSDWECLERTWAADLASSVRLSYKGAFYLMALTKAAMGAPALVDQTMSYLERAQNGDGGFGPWRDHPIGSDPWSTGICLVGVCTHPALADRRVVEGALEWLCRTQLPSGYWPCHFIDEGSAYAYWGLTEAVRFLEQS